MPAGARLSEKRPDAPKPGAADGTDRPAIYSGQARELVKQDHLILLCGHYEGFDARIRAYVDEEISIGDYVLTGGELASMVITDAVTRLVPGVITEESHLDESFENGLLEYPQYTRPVDYEGHTVPEVLLSGHHENIRKFRLKESLRLTLRVRPDLLENRNFTKEERKLLDEVLEEEEARAEAGEGLESPEIKPDLE